MFTSGFEPFVKVSVSVRVGGVLPNHRLIQSVSHQGDRQGISAATERDPQQRCYSYDAGMLAAQPHPHKQSGLPVRVTEFDWLVVGLSL